MKKIVFLLFIGIGFVSCLSKPSFKDTLKPIKIIKLNIPEPSGITAFKQNLYIVSDHNGSIYKTTLDGKILHKIDTKFNDLEGITIDETSLNFWIVDESKRQIIKLDSIGNFILKYKIKGKQKTKKGGLEGVCFVENEKCLYLLNEKSPSQLLQLNLNGEISNKFTLEIGKDISGICFDKISNSFWIVSDESQSINNVAKTGKLNKSYKIPVTKAEGIEIYNNKLYVVSDSESKLYVFKLPE